MMQLASSLEFRSQILFMDHLTPDKAEQILNVVAPSDQLTVFIDDGSSSLRAISRLVSHNNIQCIAADRSYFLEIGSHLIDRRKFEIVDVSDLERDDYNKIFAMLPESIRRTRMYVPQVAEGRSASIFEFVSKNVRDSRLSDEFVNSLPGLEKKDQEMHDLFVLSCFLHACRTPVSIDLLWGYMRSSGAARIYQKVTSLGALLAEIVSVSRYQVEDNQDYFEARSSIVAQAVVDKMPKLAFHRVFDRFHKNVSPFRIPRYSVFKRYGYDARFALRAYDNWEEGKEFYDRSFAVDQNYFLLQQLALYLNSKGRFHEAFNAIDQALEMSRGKIFSIRNSHAIVLFDANVRFAGTDEAVKGRLTKAMDILEGCYKADGRKAYHAFKYAEQAIQYDEIYGDKEGKDRLLLARNWVKEELLNPLAAKEARMSLAKLDHRL